MKWMQFFNTCINLIYLIQLHYQRENLKNCELKIAIKTKLVVP
jgi:hypothetical protein